MWVEYDNIDFYLSPVLLEISDSQQIPPHPLNTFVSQKMVYCREFLFPDDLDKTHSYLSCLPIIRSVIHLPNSHSSPQKWLAELFVPTDQYGQNICYFTHLNLRLSLVPPGPWALTHLQPDLAYTQSLMSWMLINLQKILSDQLSHKATLVSHLLMSVFFLLPYSLLPIKEHTFSAWPLRGLHVSGTEHSPHWNSLQQ